MLKRYCSALLLVTMLLPDAYANDYKCVGSGSRAPFTIEVVGLGNPDGNGDDKTITFCNKASNLNYCYASQHSIDTPAGKADYATLLTALTTGQKVSFYCVGSEYAVNIHIQQ